MEGLESELTTAQPLSGLPHALIELWLTYYVTQIETLGGFEAGGDVHGTGARIQPLEFFGIHVSGGGRWTRGTAGNSGQKYADATAHRRFTV
jgi:hypothetical protein